MPIENPKDTMVTKGMGCYDKFQIGLIVITKFLYDTIYFHISPYFTFLLMARLKGLGDYDMFESLRMFESAKMDITA